MRHLLVCLMAGLIFSACATTGGYQRKLAAFNGATEVELIRTLGVPQQSHEADGRRFLMYSSSRFVLVPTASGGMGNTRSCQTTFEIHNGVVVGSSWKGNDCRA